MSSRPSISQARRSFFSAHDDDDLTEEQRRKRTVAQKVRTIIKIIFFLITWAFFSVFLIIREPHKSHEILAPLEPGQAHAIRITDEPKGEAISVQIKGYIDEGASLNSKMAADNQSYVRLTVEKFNYEDNSSLWEAENWDVYLKSDKKTVSSVQKYIKLGSAKEDSDAVLQISLLNRHDEAVAFTLTINSNPLKPFIGVILGFLLLIYLYVLIIFDIADRTFAALLVASTAIGVLTVIHERPTLEKIISWIDTETMMLLFAMMIMVGVLGETGVFDYLAVLAYRLSKGQPWCLIFLLCMLTVVLSSFLDNVTIVMLMVPVVIRLCECMGLRTTIVLICVAIFSNIGGTLTPVGDPPNVIIVTNSYVADQGVDFLTFCIHMFPGVFFGIIGTWIYLYLVLRKKLYYGIDDQMRESLRTLAKHAAKFNAPTTVDEDKRQQIQKRIEELKEHYRRKQTFAFQPAANFIETLAEMESKFKIRNKPLLIKSCIALLVAVLLFTMHTLPFMKGLSLSWAAMIAATLLLILANFADMRTVLASVEWSTLFFFAALFALVEAVAELGLIDWVGEKTTALILSVDSEHRVVAGVMLMMWISAIFSAFIDNIPIVTMMLKLAVKLGSNAELKLPMLPMIWALSFGVCLGGNGTLIAASSNVVAAGIASQHGYKITFNEFFKYGFPVMILTDIIATVYLLIAHGWFKWH